MDYRILIKLYVPQIEESYEMYIPTNKTVGEICYLLSNLVNDLSKVYPIKNNLNLCDKFTGKIYDKNLVIKDANIKNGTELVLF